MKFQYWAIVFLIVVNINCGSKPTQTFESNKNYVNAAYEQNSLSLGYVANLNYNYTVPSFDYNIEIKRVRNTEIALKNYAAKNKCNTNYGFVIDMRLPSYKKRFFVFNLKKDSIETSGLVAHGTGSETFKGALVFSNTPDSRQTSLGKYKIGGSYNGMYGFSYKLTGLDSTNSNAFARAIVLHAHACVPDNEYDEYPICFSYGCPMVNPVFLQTLKSYISKQGKTPILMSIIY
jgi:L,D-transpeptidase catalytic domain